MRPHRRQPTRLPVPGILQARTLEWVAISFSNAWKWKVKVKSLSRVWPLATPWTAAYQAPLDWPCSNSEISWNKGTYLGATKPTPGQSIRGNCETVLEANTENLVLSLMAQKARSEVTQSCPTLCDPMDCSLPGSSVHGIFQARILEEVAISFSRGSSWPRDQTWVSEI